MSHEFSLGIVTNANIFPCMSLLLILLLLAGVIMLAVLLYCFHV